MKTIGLGLAAAALALAQNNGGAMNQNANPQNNDPHPEIAGQIVEAVTHFGVAGLQVLLTKDGQTASAATTTTTDSQGAFRFQPDDFGHYRVEVKMNGYRTVTDFSNLDLQYNNPATVVITRGNPREEIRFTVTRPAELTGRVIDEETGQPLARFPVAGVGLSYSRGVRTFGTAPGVQGVTDDDGRFLLSGLLPGNYVVETLPAALGPGRVMTTFSEPEVNVVDQDYETTYTPGGGDLDSALPISVTPGQSVGVGTIKVRRVSYYRIHVMLSADSCGGADRVAIQLRPTKFGQGLSTLVPCGTGFLIRNILPGLYTLTVASQGAAETRKQASTPVDVTNKNLDLPVSLVRGLDVEGRILFPDGAAQTSFPRLGVLLSPGGLVTPDSSGRFRVVNAPLGPFALSVVNLESGFYVREIRFGGTPVSGNSLTLTSASPSQNLEVAIDDKPALLSGVVDKDDQPVRRPYVVLAKWPYSADDLFSLKMATGEDNGGFRFAGLAPGEYRVAAVPLETKDKLDEPGVLDRLLANATKISLDRGEHQTAQLKLSDPSH